MLVTAGVPARKALGAQYLESLQALAAEMECAMAAISSNALSDLEESVGKQELLCSKLMEMARRLHPEIAIDGAGAPQPGASAAFVRPKAAVEQALSEPVGFAAGTLRRLNQRYAVLLKHSGRSIDLLSSLCGSYTGKIKGARGAGSKHQTWYCEM